MTRSYIIVAAMAALAFAAPAEAQPRIKRPPVARPLAEGAAPVPDSHRPPPGMCRIWIDGVPAGQQPAPTDCPTAVRNRPPNGRVVFGERAERAERPERPEREESAAGEGRAEERRESKGEQRGRGNRKRPNDG